MDVIGLQKAEKDDIFRMLAVILWLGNVIFNENEQGFAVVADPDGKKAIFLLVDLIFFSNCLFFSTSCKFYCIPYTSGI